MSVLAIAEGWARRTRWRDVLASLGVLLVAASMAPFALASAGVIPERLFYFAIMPLLGALLMRARIVRVNPYVGAIIFCQSAMLFAVFLVDGTRGHLLTIATLCSVLLVSMLISSGLLHVRTFVRVVVALTTVVLLCVAGSMVLAYLGYLAAVPVFARAGGDQTVYRVGLTLSNEVYPAGSGLFVRPGGVFAESGQLAMYASLAIIANAVVLRSRGYEAALIVLGLFTTSLAFYLFLPLFFVVFKRWRTLTLFLVVFLGAVVAAGGPALIRDSILWDHVLGRFMYFFTGAFGGYGGNRAASTWTVLAHLDKLNLLGSSNIPMFDGLDVDATLFGPFMTYGLLGGGLAYLHVLLFAAAPTVMWAGNPAGGRVPKTHLAAVFVLLAVNLYQRPFTLHFLYYVYLVVIFEWEYRKYLVSVPVGSSPSPAAVEFAGLPAQC